MSNEDYMTGAEMIDYLIDGIDGASGGATYAPTDISHEALVARNREIFASTAPVRGTLIDSNAFFGMDARYLEMLGLISTYYGPGHLRYSLTDLGAALAASCRA